MEELQSKFLNQLAALKIPTKKTLREVAAWCRWASYAPWQRTALTLCGGLAIIGAAAAIITSAVLILSNL